LISDIEKLPSELANISTWKGSQFYEKLKKSYETNARSMFTQVRGMKKKFLISEAEEVELIGKINEFLAGL